MIWWLIAFLGLLSWAITILLVVTRAVVDPYDRRLPIVCAACGYSRRGLPLTAMCPECGTDPAALLGNRRWERPCGAAVTVSWICAAIMCVVSITPLIASPTLASEAAFRGLSITVICVIVIVSLTLMQKRLSPLEFALMAVGGCAVPALLLYDFHSRMARHPASFQMDPLAPLALKLSWILSVPSAGLGLLIGFGLGWLLRRYDDRLFPPRVGGR